MTCGCIRAGGWPGRRSRSAPTLSTSKARRRIWTDVGRWCWRSARAAGSSYTSMSRCRWAARDSGGFYWSAAAGRRFVVVAGKRVRRRLLNVRRIHREVVHDLDTLGANPHDRLIERLLGLPFEPSRRAPRVVRWLGHQTMSHSIAVDIVQPGQIRPRISEMRIPILKPYSAAGSLILQIDFFGSDGMQMSDESRQRDCFLLGRGHEVVVIGENRPGLELPAV